MRSIPQKALVKSTSLLHWKESIQTQQRQSVGSIYFPQTTDRVIREVGKSADITRVRTCCSGQ
jgi:hypothetical protein